MSDVDRQMTAYYKTPFDLRVRVMPYATGPGRVHAVRAVPDGVTLRTGETHEGRCGRSFRVREMPWDTNHVLVDSDVAVTCAQCGTTGL